MPFFLTWHGWRTGASYLGRFLIAYGFMLIPFFIVNGALTGAFTPESVVWWYNDAENFGVRLVTIPVEDSLYLLLMMIIVIDIYEARLDRW